MAEYPGRMAGRDTRRDGIVGERAERGEADS
jgi:hypothetical protein